MGRSARLAVIAVASVALAAGAAWFLLPLGIRAFVRGLVMVVDGCVWFAASVSAGADVWTIIKAIGRAAGTALTSTQTFMIVGGLVLAGALALFGLQRLLGSEEESPR
jgi:hypothetical protein